MDDGNEHGQIPQTPSRKSRMLAVLYLLVIFVVLIGGVYYLGIFLPQQEVQQAYQETAQFLASSQYQAAQTTLAQGDYTGAVSSFQTLLAQAPTAQAKDAVSASLALSMYGSGDINSSASTYKALALNPQNLASTYPAFALDELGFLTDLVEDNPTVLQASIYNNPPYSDYLQAVNGNVFEADITLFKQADALYPSTFSKYEIAYKEARLLYTDSRAASSTTQGTTGSDMTALAKDIQQNISAGDALTKDPVLAQVLANAPAMWAQLYLFRAFALDQSNTVLGNLSDAQIDQAYDQALAFVRQDSTNVQAQAMNANIRFFYAASLDRREKARSNKNQQIESLLAYFGTAAETGKGGLSSANFLKYISLDSPNENPLTSEIAPLAAISPEFKAFLKQASITY